MPVKNWSVSWYQASIVRQYQENGLTYVELNLEKALQDKDTIEKDKYLVAKVSVTGYSPVDGAGYYKVAFNASANAVDNGQPISIRPPIMVLDQDGSVLDSYDPKVNGEVVEYTNYPMPFSQYGETDVVTFVAGPFEGDAIFNYDAETASGTVIVYQADEKTPGPGPTGAGGE